MTAALVHPRTAVRPMSLPGATRRLASVAVLAAAAAGVGTTGAALVNRVRPAPTIAPPVVTQVAAETLRPGAVRDLHVTIRNPHAFAVEVSSIGGGEVVSGAAGCDAASAVSVATRSGSFVLPASATRTFVLRNAVAMADSAAAACVGAPLSFSVEIAGARAAG